LLTANSAWYAAAAKEMYFVRTYPSERWMKHGSFPNQGNDGASAWQKNVDFTACVLSVGKVSFHGKNPGKVGPLVDDQKPAITPNGTFHHPTRLI